MSSPQLESIIQQLESCIKQGQLAAGQSLLTQGKLAMLKENNPDLACRLLEQAVLWSVAAQDSEAFSRHMAQLQAVQTAPRKPLIIGLHLMHLLVSNRLSEFHSELEVLTADQAMDPLVRFPIGLERKLMVGIYDEVLEGQVPDASYQYFMDALGPTVREAMADCMEVAYESLPVEAAAGMMKFTSKTDWDDYVQEYRNDWIVNNGQLVFSPPTSQAQASDIPSMEYIQRSLTYATEMERII
jgi:26S proteasome regulatory subunit N12